MSDETTARDRAIEVIYETLAWERERGAPIEEHADVVIDALLARPEVLRALAGAPTADAAERLRAAAAAGQAVMDGMHEPADIDVIGAWEPAISALVDLADVLGEPRDAVAEAIAAALLTAAPEGAPTADVAAVPPLEAEWNVIELGTIRASLDRAGIPDRRVGAAVRVDEALGELEQLRAAAPEGVDAADEQHVRRDDMCLTCSRATHTVVPWPCEYADDGMDLEAQGEMADQLAAAQAANQRVRELHVSSLEGRWCATCRGPYPCPSVRALDGDTTEEGP